MLDEGLHESKVTAEGGKVDGSTPLLVLEGGVSSRMEENLSTLLKSISNLYAIRSNHILYQESHQREVEGNLKFYTIIN